MRVTVPVTTWLVPPSAGLGASVSDLIPTGTTSETSKLAVAAAGPVVSVITKRPSGLAGLHVATNQTAHTVSASVIGVFTVKLTFPFPGWRSALVFHSPEALMLRLPRLRSLGRTGVRSEAPKQLSAPFGRTSQLLRAE